MNKKIKIKKKQKKNIKKFAPILCWITIDLNFTIIDYYNY